jgi:hypothetical protein
MCSLEVDLCRSRGDIPLALVDQSSAVVHFNLKIQQTVKRVTELARHSSENTLSLSLSPRPTKTGKGIIRMDDLWIYQGLDRPILITGVITQVQRNF